MIVMLTLGLPDAHDRESAGMKEYNHSLNRFTGKYANTTRHIYSPTKILHLSNFDEGTTEEVPWLTL